jgi:hypothetical protein
MDYDLIVQFPMGRGEIIDDSGQIQVINFEQAELTAMMIMTKAAIAIARGKGWEVLDKVGLTYQS